MDINTFQSSFVCFHARLKSSLADQLWSYLWIKSFWKRLSLLGEIFQNFSMVKELFIWPGASTSLLWPVLLLFHCTFIFLFFVTQSCPTLCDQTPPVMGFSRPEYWSGLPFPSPADLPNPGIEPGSPALQADALPSRPPGKFTALTTLNPLV